jgi:hypothetical protein
VVDIGRSTYRTLARLYPDSDEVFEIEWYVARDDAPLLGFPSALNQLIWARDHDEYLITAVGEIPLAPWIKTRYHTPPLALGDHYCGTEDDFAGQGTYDDTSPDVTYRPDGLPTCCGPLVEGTGGLGLSGVAPYTPQDGTEGGLAIGGQAGDISAYTDPSAGGLSLGGQSGDTHGTIDPSAGGLALGGQAGETGTYTDPTAGGVAVGGQAGDVLVYADPTAGGVAIGGQAGDIPVYVDPTQGGAAIGGQSGDVLVYADPSQGGLALGGQTGETGTYTDPTSGGMAIGGSVTDVSIGTISTENATGGPESLSNAIVLIGGTGVVLSQTGPDITINVSSVGPAPGQATGITAVGASTQVTVSWTAPTGSPSATKYGVWYGTGSSFNSAAEFGSGTTGTSQAVTGLANLTLYYFWVVSYYNGASSVAGPVTCTPSPYALYDTFGGTSGTALTAHTPNVGGPWSILSGATAPQLGTGGLNVDTGSGATVAPIGSPNMTASIIYYYHTTILVTGSTVGLWMRAPASLADSGYLCRVNIATGGPCEAVIYKYPGGSLIATGSVPALVGGTTYTFSASCSSANLISFTANGVTISATDTTLSTNTYCGVYVPSNSGDYISVIEVSSP